MKNNTENEIAIAMNTGVDAVGAERRRSGALLGRAARSVWYQVSVARNLKKCTDYTEGKVMDLYSRDQQHYSVGNKNLILRVLS